MIPHLLISLLFFTSLPFSLSSTFLSTISNSPTDDTTIPSPVIGLLTQPSPFSSAGYPASEFSYIPASYVKHLESAGATIVPIQWDLPLAELDALLSKVNGILLPGGGSTLVDSKTGNASLFAQAGMHIVQKAMEFNDNGDYFPIWGTCLGYELLMLTISNNMTLLVDVADGNDVAKALNITDEGLDGLYSSIDASLLDNVKTMNLSYFHHKHTPDPASFTNDTNIASNFSVAAWSYDSEAGQYAATVQGKVYPFTGTQFHPEKNTFEWQTGTAIPHSLEGVLHQEYYAYYLVNQTMGNGHRFKSLDDLAENWIYNYQPHHLGPDPMFEQVYLFKNCESYDEKEKFVAEYPRGFEPSEEESDSDAIGEDFKFKEAAKFLFVKEERTISY